MEINTKYNPYISRMNRAQRASKHVQEKPIEKEKPKTHSQTDRYTPSTPEDIAYQKHIAAYNEYMAILASTAIQHKKELSASEEIKMDEKNELISAVEECGNSNPTHNNETHHFNKHSQKESKNHKKDQSILVNKSL